jgi:hypothetical protein
MKGIPVTIAGQRCRISHEQARALGLLKPKRKRKPDPPLPTYEEAWKGFKSRVREMDARKARMK